MSRKVLAIDLGAESGRVIGVSFDGQRLTSEAIDRFPNIPIDVRGTLYWDILRLWHDVQTGIGKAGEADSLAINGWGVDFALLDPYDRLVDNPVHYRDARTRGMMDWVSARVPAAEVFNRTGIQNLAINSLYQLASLARNQPDTLARSSYFLAIPDLIYFWLTGIKANEFTVASTSQCLVTATREWAFDILDRLGIPARLFHPVSEPAQILGSYHQTPVVLGTHHDTACAVVAVPAEGDDYAYLSSGTWSLFGVEEPAPIINAAAMAANMTNEGGFGGKIRVLKPIMGLWILQESRR
ncbi:MAG TPA: FGGY family carbohydrate kinase, partial [Aggregatilineales bacterium]|nr:FGGY family carbohydrate kinase [Aggregatilineales bacterium]